MSTTAKKLMLRHTWTTTMSSSTFRETVNLRHTRGGVTGYGEGVPIARYKVSPEQAKLGSDVAWD